MEKVIALGHEESIKAGLHLYHPLFDYIPDADFAEIESEILRNQSFIISFWKNDELKAVGIFTVYNESIHIRELAGSYVWATDYAEIYAKIVAGALNKPKITFYAENDIIKKAAQKRGWIKDNFYDNEFYKMVA